MSSGGKGGAGRVLREAEAVVGCARGWAVLGRWAWTAVVCWTLVLPTGSVAHELGDVDTAKKLAAASLVIGCVVQDRNLKSVQDFKAMTAGELADSYAKCTLAWGKELADVGLATEKSLSVIGQAAALALYLSAAKQKEGGRR